MPRDLYLSGYRKTLEVDWDGDGSWDHARTVVSADEFRADVSFGTSRRSNPQRPTIAAGKGKITLLGDDFVPGRSTVLTSAQLQQRHRCRLKMVIGNDTETLWDGWLQSARHQRGQSTSFDWEGLLERPGRERREVSQSSTVMNSDDTAVLTLLRNAYRLSAANFAADIAETPLGVYTFDGPAAQYASNFAQVSGGLPCARRAGALRLQDPNRRPASVTVFRSSEYDVLEATTEFGSEQLWNAARLAFMDRDASNVLTGLIGSGAVSSDSETDTFTFTPPSLPSGATQDGDTEIIASATGARATGSWYRYYTSLTNAAVYRDFNKVFEAVSFSIMIPTSLSGTTVTVGPVTNADISSIFTPQEDHLEYNRSEWLASNFNTWVDREGGNEIPGATRITYDVRYRIRYDRTVETPDEVFGLSDSISAWGRRELTFPLWFRAGASASVRARLNALSSPRNIITADFALDQPDDTKTLTLSRIDPGDHIGIFDEDAVDEIDINATVMVMQVRYRLDPDKIDLKTLTCIEAGAEAITVVVPDAPDAPSVSTSTDYAALDVSWSPPSSNGGSAISSYNLRYKTSAGSTWTEITGISGTTRQLTGLAHGTSYDVQVAAVNRAGASDWSASGTASTRTRSAPSVPRSLAVVAGTLNTVLNASWAVPASDGGAAIESYDLRYRAGTTGAWTTINNLTELTRSLTGLTPNTGYQVQVRAVNAIGDGPWTPTATATTGATVPSRMIAPVVDAVGTAALSVTWTAPNNGGSPITIYRLRYRTGAGAWTEVSDLTGTTYNLLSLSPSTTYEVQLLAVNAVGPATDWSPSGSATTGQVQRFGDAEPATIVISIPDAEAANTAQHGDAEAATVVIDIPDATGTGALEHFADAEPAELVIDIPDATGEAGIAIPAGAITLGGIPIVFDDRFLVLDEDS